MRPLIITIDGPAGAGKTTVSRALAKRLGYRYIDTGALYRAVAFEVKSAGLDPCDETELESLCRHLKLKYEIDGSSMRLLSNNLDITGQIRSQEIAMLASEVSAKLTVRKYLFKLQRDLGKEGGVVFEGRDMGTVVFPDADMKFFMDASHKIRALRRYRELEPKTLKQLDEIENDIRRRDENDKTRSLAPLKPAEDAVIINSTCLSVENVVDLMLTYVRRRFSLNFL